MASKLLIFICSLFFVSYLPWTRMRNPPTPALLYDRPLPPLYDDLRWIPLPSHNGAVFGARYKSRVLCVLGMPATV